MVQVSIVSWETMSRGLLHALPKSRQQKRKVVYTLFLPRSPLSKESLTTCTSLLPNQVGKPPGVDPRVRLTALVDSQSVLDQGRTKVTILACSESTPALWDIRHMEMRSSRTSRTCHCLYPTRPRLPMTLSKIGNPQQNHVGTWG